MGGFGDLAALKEQWRPPEEVHPTGNELVDTLSGLKPRPGRPVEGPEPVADQEAVGQDRTALDAANQRSAKERAFADPRGLMGPVGPGVAYRPEGENWAPLGGTDDYYEAFMPEGAPGQRDRAMHEIGQLQEQKGKELEAHYTRERDRAVQAAGVRKLRSEEQAAETQRRMQELDSATRAVTADLRDSGRFWRNPGNIIAAISYSLMPILSNDPTVGVKLIQQAIDQDMANRREAGRATLAGLQGNLSAYRQLVGDDRQAQMLEEAEANRVAAQEVQRIAARFEGPIAARNAKVVIANLNARDAALRMQVYNSSVYMPVAKEDPAMTKERMANPHGFNPLKNRYLSESDELSQSPVPGSPSMASKSVPGPSMVGGTGNTAPPNPWEQGQNQDEQELQQVRQYLARKAMRKNPNHPEKAWDEILEKADDRIQAVQKDVADHNAQHLRISDLVSKIEEIQRAERLKGRDPEEWRGAYRKVIPMGMLNAYEDLRAKDPEGIANSAERRIALRDQAVRLYEAQLRSVGNDIAHSKFGGAQTAVGPEGGEMGRMRQEFRQDMPLADMRKVLIGWDVAEQDDLDKRISALPPEAKAILRIRTGQSLDRLRRPNAGKIGKD